MKNRKTKWFVTICAIITFLLVGTLIPAESLNFRAMIVGFGIDLVDDNNIRVSAQILTTTSQSGDAATSSSRVVAKENQTITGAMVEITKITGLAATLTHCNVVMLGEDLIKSEYYYSCLNYIIINDYLNDNALVFATEGTAEEILSSKTGFGNNASVYAQKLVGKFANFNTMYHKTIHELLIDYHQKGQAVWIPYLKSQPVAPEVPSSSSENTGETPAKEDAVFTIEEIVMLKKDTFMGVYDKACTSSLNYVIHTIKRAYLDTKGDNNEDICFYINGSNKKVDCDWATKTVTCSITLNAILKEIVDYSKPNKIVDRSIVTQSELRRAEKNIVMQIEGFYDILQTLDLDIYAFEECFYAKDKKKVKDFNLKEITFIVDVKIKID